MKRQFYKHTLIQHTNKKFDYYSEQATPYTLISRHKEEKGIKLNDIYDVVEALNIIVYNIPVEVTNGYRKPLASVGYNIYLDRYRKFV